MKKSLVSISLVLVLCSTLGAWEADVHYGLTRWLAVNAGFTPAAAELIASADLSADLGSFNPATWAVGFHILILGDVGASKRVQQLHFPSYGPVPGDPGKRSVPQDSSRALDWLRKDTQFPTSSVSESAELEDFGLALHSLQDSWSHEGEPDVAFRCFGLTPRSQLSWAHPIDRGGWAVHDADLTYLWKSDLTNRPIDMAHATFDALVAYGGAHIRMRSSTSPLSGTYWNRALRNSSRLGRKTTRKPGSSLTPISRFQATETRLSSTACRYPRRAPHYERSSSRAIRAPMS